MFQISDQILISYSILSIHEKKIKNFFPGYINIFLFDIIRIKIILKKNVFSLEHYVLH